MERSFITRFIRPLGSSGLETRIPKSEECHDEVCKTPRILVSSMNT